VVVVYGFAKNIHHKLQGPSKVPRDDITQSLLQSLPMEIDVLVVLFFTSISPPSAGGGA
jgi:hypothetical protein